MDDDIHERLAAHQHREAFELLLGRFKDRVFRLACGLLRDETAAEDMTQDIFIRVWKALPGYQGAASISTWLYTIARNACLTELKRRAARPTVSLHAPEIEALGDCLPALQTTDAEGGVEMDVQALLASLPGKYRQVITLFYLEQRSYEEVGAMLGLPLGTVKTFLFRAKRELLKLATRRPPAVVPA
jgi:RNA polymerase sigma-70 factor (ECF subfamily)